MHKIEMILLCGAMLAIGLLVGEGIGEEVHYRAVLKGSAFDDGPMCSMDGKTWFAARKGVCYTADIPRS